MKIRNQLAFGAALSGMLAVSPALAQQAPSSEDAVEGDSTIVVTAAKQGAQDLQEVPLAIQAFSGDALKQANIQDLGELIASVPGAYEGQNQFVGSRSYNIRGVGGSNANGDSPIGYYIDDVPFNVPNFGIAPPLRFIDIEQVEVLRGPHGTLYGQGSAGGVFIFRTRDPDLDKIEFAAEGTLSSTRGASGLNYEVSGALSVPIVKDLLAVRVSGGYLESKGWADEYFGAFDGTPDRKDINVVRNDDLRVVALLQPTPNFSIRAQYWQFRPRQQGLGALQSIEPPYYSGTDAQPNFGNGDFKLYSLTAKLDLDAVNLTSATTYLKGVFGINVPIAASPFNPGGNFTSYFLPKSFTQEIRANSASDGPFKWLIGGQYQDSSGPQENRVTFLPFNFDNNTIVESKAVFGEVSYELMDGKLIPLVGLRQYWEDRTFDGGTGTTSTNSESVTTWRANLSYLPSDRLTLFATVATGFRPGIVLSQGQVAALQTDGIPAGVQLDPENVTNYEIGGRWVDPSGRLTIGLNAYLIDIEGQQTSINTSAGIGAFVNFGDARTKGVDLSLSWKAPLDGLTLSAVGNLNDGYYTFVRPEVQPGLPFIAKGGRLVNSVEFNYRLDASYQRKISNDLEFFGNLSLSHTGNRLTTVGTLGSPYNLSNVSAGLRHGPFEASIFANNLFDERGPTNIFGTTGSISAVPRTIGLRLRVNYR